MVVTLWSSCFWCLLNSYIESYLDFFDTSTSQFLLTVTAPLHQHNLFDHYPESSWTFPRMLNSSESSKRFPRILVNIPLVLSVPRPPALESFLSIKLQDRNIQLYLKYTPIQVFSGEFCKHLKNNYFVEHLQK